MKTKSNIHIILVISALAPAAAPSLAQTNGPLSITWQATYGPAKNKQGVGYAVPYDFVQTPDGGFLIAGNAEGFANGIRTEPFCEGGDVWVIKIDSQGQRQWDRSCGGDISWGPAEIATRVFLTSDEGFLLAGWSASEPGCCKAAALLGADLANFWVVRYDAGGNKLWDQSYLPDGFDYSWGQDFEPTADGGYLGSGTGGAEQQGGYYGIVKIDAAGGRLWARSFGCPTTAFAEALRVRETADGGFIVAGCSASPPCSGKTAPYYGGASSANPFLGSDIWVVRVDAQGNKLWDKSYGGTGLELAFDIHPLADGGFMVFGSSESAPVTNPSLGTKTSPRYGLQDFWIVRIDGDGNQLWDKSYGGLTDDILTSVEPMPDGGWLLAGTSSSPPLARGGKTAPRFGSSDFWILRIDAEGNRLWDQSFGGTGNEGKEWRAYSPPQFMRERIRHTKEGGFLLVGFSGSPAGVMKTAPLIGQGDFWALKLGPEPPFLRGQVTAEGQFQLRLIGPPEFSHTIQGSTDMVAWTDLVTLPPNPAGTVNWTDPDKLPHRFYRAIRK